MYVFLNDRLVKANEAKIQAVSDGLFYGAGCFETLKVYQGQFLHLNQHIERLHKGIQYLTGNDQHRISEKEIRKNILNLIDQNKLLQVNSKVRIQVLLEGRFGYSQPSESNLKLMFLITSMKLDANEVKPVSLATTNIRVVPSACKPAHIKLSNMLHYRQAGIDAKQQGADDALMFTTGGTIAETSIANLFWEKNGVVYTPSVQCDILPGIMRGILIGLIDKLGYECKLSAFPRSSIDDANQVWITNSVREINWVGSIDGNRYKTDTELSSKLKIALEAYKKTHLK